MFIAFLVAFAYIMIGLIMGGLIWGWDTQENDADFLTFVILMWPIVLLIVIGWLIFKSSLKLGNFLHQKYGNNRN